MSTLAFRDAGENDTNNNSIPVGTRVRVNSTLVDFFFFNMQEVGTVTANNGRHLGITVTFDKPIRYKAGGRQEIHTKTEHGFNASNLQIIEGPQ